MSFKSRLHEYTQKAGFPIPVYETLSEGPHHNLMFRSTVIVNGVSFQSLLGFTNRKEAEQSAAQVALEALDAEHKRKRKEPMPSSSHRDEIKDAVDTKKNRSCENTSDHNPFDDLVENLSLSEKLILLKRIVKDL